MVFEEQAFKGVYIVNPIIFYDERGSFFESFKDNEFENKLNCKFVQDNEVFSEKVNESKINSKFNESFLNREYL